MPEVFRSGKLLAEAMLAAWREFGHDMILLENGTACNAEACGVEARYREDTAPVAGKPILKRLEDVADLTVPDPYTTFPMSEILEATRILKSRDLTRRVPIVALTAQAMKEDEARAVNAGCDGFIAKPISTRLFLTEVARYVGRASSAAE